MILAPSRARRRTAYLAAAMVGAAVIAGGFVVIRAAAQTGCVTLDVSVSTEKALLLAEIAKRYAAADRTLPSGRCATIRTVGFVSGEASEAIAGGWTAELAGNGADGSPRPRPQVWLPTSSMWVTRLRADKAYAGAAQLATHLTSVAHSPLVIAMPKDLAGALGWPGKDLRWMDVLGLPGDTWAKTHPEWGRFSYAKDDPRRSTSGLAATIATYYAAAGRQSNLRVEDVRAEATENAVRQVEANVVYHPPDIMDFLPELGAAEGRSGQQKYVSAVVMQEELAYGVDRGNPDGDPALIDSGKAPTDQLVAIHPSDGTIVLDHPYVVLPGVDALQKEAADDLLGFIEEPAQQELFRAVGFRDVDNNAPKAVAQVLGFPAGSRPSVLPDPSAAVIDAIVDSWTKLSKRADVLVVVDASGSMPASGNSDHVDRMAAAQAALRANRRLLNPDDRVGLWSFASNPNDLHPALLDVDSYGRGDKLGAAIERLQVAKRPYDDTALCVTIRDAHREMRERADPSRINAVVVLTDGRNDYSRDPCTMGALAGELTAADPEHMVKVFGIGFGLREGTPEFAELQAVSQATGAPTSVAISPGEIDTAFADIFRAVSAGT